MNRYSIISLLLSREIKIEEAFKLWNDTAQDDYRLLGRKQRLDDLMNEKRTLLTIQAGQHKIIYPHHR